MSSTGRRRLPAVPRPAVFADTKFVPARPPVWSVDRRELVQRLVEADGLPLTVVVGSAGSGKSWLIGEWFRAAGVDGSATWLSADRGDADPVRFWRAFVTAVQRIEPGFGVATVDAMTLDGAVSADALEDLLVDDARLGRRLRIVIDDVHLVSPDALAQLRHLLDRGLRNLRLILIGRSEPAVGVQRLRLRREVYELREGHLRFGVAETRRLLAELGIDPDRIDVDEVHRRTEGWVAGVQMAALSAVGADDPAQRIGEVLSGGRMIAEYLAAEVLANQSAAVRRFLEDTCVLDDLDTELCRELTRGGEGAKVALAQIEEGGLMIARLDAEGTAFRYHQLFADTLRARLRAHEPDRFRAQHLRAAEVFEARGTTTSAIRHYWFADRRDQAARMIRGNVVSVLLDPGAPPPVEELELGLSREELAAAPGDAAGYALALVMNARPADAYNLLDAVDAVVPQNIDPVDRVHLLCARTGTAVLLGDSAGASRAMAEVSAAIAEGVVSPDAWTAAALPQGIRASAWEGDFERAVQLVASARMYSAGHLDAHLERVELAGALAFVHLESGDLVEAVSHARDGVAAAAELSLEGSGGEAAVLAVLSVALLEQGLLDEAASYVDRTLESGRTERIPSMVLASIAKARLLRAQGLFDAALAVLESGRSGLGRVGTTGALSSRLDQVEIMVRLVMGDVTTASLLADRMRPGHSGQLMRAWVDVAAGRSTVAASIASGLRESASTPRRRLDALLLSARLAEAASSPEVDTLALEILDAVEASGAVQVVAEAGTPVLSAVVRASRSRPRSPTIERLLVTRPLPRPSDQARPEYRVEELSARELIVLQYMATSLSNQEIARELYLSVNTVKTHVKHVLRKLRATSRAEAVDRAQALHYL